MKRALYLALLIIFAATPAMAIDIQNFHTAIGSNNLFSVYQSDALEPWQFVVGASSNIAGSPLTFTLPDDEELNVVDQMVGNQFYAAFGIAGYVDIGVAGSFNQISGQDLDRGVEASPIFADDNDTRFVGAGDVRVMAKGRILENKPKSIGLALVPFAHFPTGDPAYYNGAGAIDIGGIFVIDKRFDRVNIAGNVEYKYKGVSVGENEEDIIPNDEILTGLGISVYAHRIVDVIAELYGKTVNYNLDNIDGEVPIEALAGVKLYGGYGLSFLVAGGGGITSGIGSPSYRGLLGFEFTYPFIDRTPPMVARKTGPVVDANSKSEDTDRDGLSNYDENNTYGTDFMNPDSDGDGLKDGNEIHTHKTHPSKPDTDGDDLSDGEEIKLYGTSALLIDTDGDTLPDGVEIKEIGTNPATPDSDNDKVPDNLDGAPLQAETYNGYQDQDGVPEVTLAKRPSGVVMFENVIWLPGKIHWTGRRNDRIAPESRSMLDDIAVMLSEYSALKVQIESHVARGGDEAKNKDLTMRRSEEVRIYLIRKGVSADRLVAVGSGSDFPIASNSTPEGREKNERTEFVIVEK